MEVFYAKMPNRCIAIGFRCRVKENTCLLVDVPFLFSEVFLQNIHDSIEFHPLGTPVVNGCPIEKQSTVIASASNGLWKGFDFNGAIVDDCYKNYHSYSAFKIYMCSLHLTPNQYSFQRSICHFFVFSPNSLIC